MKAKLTMTALLALCVTMTAATLGPPFQPPADRQCLVMLNADWGHVALTALLLIAFFWRWMWTGTRRKGKR